jgi:predicted RNase H-like HicB family nuclease
MSEQDACVVPFDYRGLHTLCLGLAPRNRTNRDCSYRWPGHHRWSRVDAPVGGALITLHGRRILRNEITDAKLQCVVERDPDTGLFVGHVPGWPGAHSQGESLDELQRNRQEVVSMLLEDGEPKRPDTLRASP